MTELEKALSTFFDDAELGAHLAPVLAYAGKTGSISYSEVISIAGDFADEVLLSANEWRLLLPARAEKSGAWEDRQLICRQGEFYELPNIVRHLVQNSGKTGDWEPVTAVTGIFNEIGEPAWQEMPGLVMELGKQAQDNRISGSQIREICFSTYTGTKADTLIAELKAAGVMSPRLGPLVEVARTGSPVYELNPSLFIKKLQ